MNALTFSKGRSVVLEASLWRDSGYLGESFRAVSSLLCKFQDMGSTVRHPGFNSWFCVLLL